VAAKSIRDNRYCEVLLAFFQDESITAQVWGTQGLNACPQEAWATVDAMAIQTEYGAAGVVLNGPRHWTIDGATAELPAGSPKLFGQLEMQQLATLSVAPGMVSSKPYVERTVLRNSKFEFFAGTEIYELVAPTGAVYVMQSYAQIVDATLTASDLPGLASRLKLPTGWQYRVRTLTSALQIQTPGEATVVQDELQNSYSKYPAVP
jgi:haloalkane dehalogenase